MRQTGRFTLLTALMLLSAATLPLAAKPEIVPPPVPANLEVPAGHKAFLEGRAFGTQNYICMPSASGFSWTFFGPQATLFNEDMGQTMTHYLSPNPVENGTPRATWQHSNDTSAVWAMAIANSSDPAYVEAGAIPWLLLRVVGAAQGPTSGDKLTETMFIHRVKTSGGIAPADGCATATDVGKRSLVPYQTDYIFYRAID